MTVFEGWDDILAVEACGGVGKAAQSLGISQSAMTRRLQGLEESLGVRILEKKGRTVSFTPAGEALLRHARAARGSWMAVRDQIRDMGSQLSAPRRVVVTPGAVHDLNVHILPGLPDRPHWFQVMTPARCWQSVAEGSADEAWALIPEEYMQELSRLYGQCTHHIQGRDQLSPFSIADAGTPRFSLGHGRGKAPPLVLYTPGTLTGEAIRKKLKDSRLDMTGKIRAEVSASDLVLGLVAAGQGVGWIPERHVTASAHARTCVKTGRQDWRIPLCLVRTVRFPASSPPSGPHR
ncbi:MAG: LysR family transcriptional regulator [Pseudomonadota bacterium]|nr:LysR family transcriptional regulator [Pseudomonadota bacterium]